MSDFFPETPLRLLLSLLVLCVATSAAGYVKIRLCGNAAALTSCELFGDSIDRRVVFQGGEVSSLAGQPVTMEVEMSDADLYSFKFVQ